MAWVSLREGATIDEDDVRSSARAGSPTSRSAVREVVDEFPMTVTGKVRKVEMRESGRGGRARPPVGCSDMWGGWGWGEDGGGVSRFGARRPAQVEVAGGGIVDAAQRADAELDLGLLAPITGPCLLIPVEHRLHTPAAEPVRPRAQPEVERLYPAVAEQPTEPAAGT